MVSDTKPLEKSCSSCGESKEYTLFMKNRNICKACRNNKAREKYKASTENKIAYTTICNICEQTKPSSSFYTRLKICKDCCNERRRKKYQTDEEHRLKMIKQSSEFKHKLVLERRQEKLEEIGENNKKCSICFTIKPTCNFRYNRLKCKDCERDDPLEKFKRIIRSRIYIALKSKKSMKTIQYLGCSKNDYLEWMLRNDKNYTLDNHGKEWHIDHVIPLSCFDLEKEDQQLIAFNWRNTMPLNAKENLAKNNRILLPQLEQHYKNVSDYQKEKNIEMPQVFVDLFAKHLAVRELP